MYNDLSIGLSGLKNLLFFQNTSNLAKNRINLDINKILLKKEPTPKDFYFFFKLTVKILFGPITILVFLINRLFSKIAAIHGLGTKEQLKKINSEKRGALLNNRGEQIWFGFNKEPLLEGMYFKTNSSRAKTILICSGSHYSYEQYTIPMVDALLSMDHNVMIFNYEGFGNSEGSASEKGVYRSAEAAYQYLKQEKNCKDEEIIAWGYSLGSGAATNLALTHKITLVLDRGFSSMSEVAYQSAARGLKHIARLIFIIGAHFDNVSKLKKIKGKILLAQGIHDKTMNWENHGKFLYNAILENINADYLNVHSGHLHTENHVWFAKGKNRTFIKDFLKKS